MDTEDLFDVVIYHYETGIVESIAGSAMRRHGFYSATKRRETASRRINDKYKVVIVPYGHAEVGKPMPLH